MAAAAATIVRLAWIWCKPEYARGGSDGYAGTASSQGSHA
jgi:hypothetical protein